MGWRSSTAPIKQMDHTKETNTLEARSPKNLIGSFSPDSCHADDVLVTEGMGQNRTKKDEDPASIRSPSLSIFSLSAKFAYDPHPDSSTLAAGQVKRQVTPEGA